MKKKSTFRWWSQMVYLGEEFCSRQLFRFIPEFV
ncbi:hypothetical protein PDESU_05749 [Pontiella desulfatans]|uniref:Uncharacterized protein n=1 Tax=Pontiella desulfatans TaxID=2750659 RepID=A0A6C2UCQ4_PONDE|nr:hypothetical protein PDESU_05749 [Pontiella desulfatans]